MISKKITYLLLTSLFFFMMVLRYPQDSTINISGDSVVYPDRALQIFEKGEIGFILHPLSYFGKYPFSYAAGLPVFISSLMTITGLSISNTILLYSYILGFLCILGPFFLIRIFVPSNISVLVGCLCFIVQKYLLINGTNTMHFRTFTLAFVPFLMIFVWRLYQHPSLKLFFASLILLILMNAFHRLSAYFIPVIIIPILILSIWNRLENRYKILTINKTRSILFLWIFSSAIISLYFIDFLSNIGFQIQKTGDIDNNRIEMYFLNPVLGLANYYTVSSLLNFLCVFGILSLFFSSRIIFFDRHKLLLLYLAGSSLFLVDAMYFMIIFISIIAICCSYGVDQIKQIDFFNNNKKFFAFFASVFILVSIFYPFFLLHTNQDTYDSYYSERGFGGSGRHVPYEAVDSGLWRNAYMDYDDRILALSPEAYMLGYYGTPLQTMADYSLVASDIDVWTNSMDIDAFSSIQILFNIRGESSGGHYGGNIEFSDTPYYAGLGKDSILLDKPKGDIYIETFEVSYVVTTDTDFEEVTPEYVFSSQIDSSKYKVYSNEFCVIYHYKNWR